MGSACYTLEQIKRRGAPPAELGSVGAARAAATTNSIRGR